MGIQKVKDELLQFHYDYQYYLEKMKELEKLKEQTEKSLFRLDQFKKSGETSSINSRIEEIISAQADEESAVVNFLEKKRQLEKSINQLSQPYRTVLYMRYVRFCTFDQIADKMSYSTKRIYQLHQKGLELYEQILNANGASDAKRK